MLISLAEYAAKHGVKQATVRQKILRGNLEAQKIGRNWVIEEDTPYIDTRVKSGKYVDWRKPKKIMNNKGIQTDAFLYVNIKESAVFYNLQ